MSMSDKRINYILTVTVLVLAAVYIYFYLSIGDGNKIEPLILGIEKDIKKEAWLAAKKKVYKLEQVWSRKTSYWISVNFAEAEFAIFDDDLAILRANIELEDKVGALERIYLLSDKWENFNNLVPKP